MRGFQDNPKRHYLLIIPSYTPYSPPTGRIPTARQQSHREVRLKQSYFKIGSFCSRKIFLCTSLQYNIYV